MQKADINPMRLPGRKSPHPYHPGHSPTNNQSSHSPPTTKFICPTMKVIALFIIALACLTPAAPACSIDKNGVVTREVFSNKPKCSFKRIKRAVACGCGLFNDEISEDLQRMCAELFNNRSVRRLTRVCRRGRLGQGKKKNIRNKVLKALTFISTKCFRSKRKRTMSMGPTETQEPYESMEVSESPEPYESMEPTSIPMPSMLMDVLEKSVKCSICIEIGNCISS